jgi:hypothetical protein
MYHGKYRHIHLKEGKLPAENFGVHTEKHERVLLWFSLL